MEHKTFLQLGKFLIVKDYSDFSESLLLYSWNFGAICSFVVLNSLKYTIKIGKWEEHSPSMLFTKVNSRGSTLKTSETRAEKGVSKGQSHWAQFQELFSEATVYGE